MVNVQSIKEAVAARVRDVDGVREVIVGAPYFDNIKSAANNSRTVYVTNAGQLTEYGLRGTTDSDRYTDVERTYRLLLICVVIDADGRRAEAALDSMIDGIEDVILADKNLGGATPPIVHYAIPESVYVPTDEMGGTKQARVMRLKCVA